MAALPKLPDVSSHAPAFLAGWRRWWITRWLRAKVVDPSLVILRRGAEPKQLAWSLTLGFTTGLFPLCGLTAALCGLVALALRAQCHPPTMMLANLLATPFELSLIVPFMRFGERLTGAAPMSLKPDALWQAVSGKASTAVLLALAHALLGYLIAAPFILWGLYSLSLPLVTHLLTRRTPVVSPTMQGSKLPQRTSPKGGASGHLGRGQEYAV